MTTTPPIEKIMDTQAINQGNSMPALLILIVITSFLTSCSNQPAPPGADVPSNTNHPAPTTDEVGSDRVTTVVCGELEQYGKYVYANIYAPVHLEGKDLEVSATGASILVSALTQIGSFIDGEPDLEVSLNKAGPSTRSAFTNLLRESQELHDRLVSSARAGLDAKKEDFVELFDAFSISIDTCSAEGLRPEWARS
ncbi:hypothetical protein [Actinokineospora sp. NPDC004072]